MSLFRFTSHHSKTVLRTQYSPLLSRSFSIKDVLDFNEYIEKVGPTLEPPVANKLIYGDGFLKVMIVGGPNIRKDYHLQAGEEFFWQMKGDLTLNVVLKGRFEKIHVPEGYCYLLPSHIPHSPQRGANSMGLVIERGHEHDKKELDRVRWYDNDENVGGLAAIDDGGMKLNEQEQYANILYEEFFHCKDLGTELGPVINRFRHFYGDLKNEQNQIEKEQNLNLIISQQNEIKQNSKMILSNPKAPDFGSPFKFDPWIDSKILEINSTYSSSPSAPLHAKMINMWKGNEKTIDLIVGDGTLACGEIHGKQQSLLYQVRGSANVITLKRKVHLKQGNMLLLDAREGTPIITQQNKNDTNGPPIGATLMVRNQLNLVG